MRNQFFRFVPLVTGGKGELKLTEHEFEKIINKYSKLLWSAAARILDGIGNDQDIEECVADVFIDLWFAPQAFDSSRGSLKTWLCIKCRSKAIDRFRKITAHITDELNSEIVSGMMGPDEKVVTKEDLMMLKKAVMEMEEPSKEIMIRRFFKGQKPSEISKAMELPVRKVENIIYRSKTKLRNDLEG